MKIQMITQYNVLFDNAPGMAAKLTNMLSKEKISFGSPITATIGKKVVLQFLAYKDISLRERLERKGMLVREDPVFQIEMPNEHWELHKLAKALAAKGINILSLHTTVERKTVKMVLAVDQPANAVELAAELGFKPDYLVV